METSYLITLLCHPRHALVSYVFLCFYVAMSIVLTECVEINQIKSNSQKDTSAWPGRVQVAPAQEDDLAAEGDVLRVAAETRLVLRLRVLGRKPHLVSRHQSCKRIQERTKGTFKIMSTVSFTKYLDFHEIK